MLRRLIARCGHLVLVVVLMMVAACPPVAPPQGCATNADCADATLCNGVETCGGDGTCVAGTAVTCDAGETCNPATGMCAGGDEPPAEFELGGMEPPLAEIEARPQSVNPFAAGSEDLPRRVDLSRSAPPIGDQGGLPSCTAWATGYAAASYNANLRFDWGADTADEQASAAYLYERLLTLDGFDCPSGTFIGTALDLLVQEGTPSLAVAPYDTLTCPANTPNADADNFKIGSYNRIEGFDRNTLRGELARNNILVIGARLDDDFLDYRGVSEVYVGSGVALMQGAVHAAHAMAVVGYDDDLEAFRLMNSWGTAWGDDGFMHIAYDTFERMVFEVYVLESTDDRTPDDDLVPPPPTGDVELLLDDGYQFAAFEDDTDGMRQFVAYLVIFFRATEPVRLTTITVTDPSGAAMDAEYGNVFSEGYVSFVNPGGEWPTGTYSLSAIAELTDGTSNTLTIDEIVIGPIDDDEQTDDILCDDTCPYAYDGECDDGGPNSDFFVCDFGTDCSDCGPRDDVIIVDPNTVCTDDCFYAGDGECDDGGPGSDFFVCDFGTDCTDCGPRDAVTTDLFCEDYCFAAFDGECDDGGFDADFAVCDFGSDCFDCGPRSDEDVIIIEDTLCFDSCFFAFDGECDDGGPDADFAECDFGSDCFDCGERGLDDCGEQVICFDDCIFMFDGECDDGGPGADTAFCELGSDCFDCGATILEGGECGGDFDPTILCTDDCFDAGDGFCDDGGPGADTDLCPLGTDCFDCGPIELDDFKAAIRITGKSTARKASPNVSRKTKGTGYTGRKFDQRTSKSAKAGRTTKATTMQSASAQAKQVRYFRGVKVQTPTGAKNLPVKGIHEGILGPNRKPVKVMTPATDAREAMSHEATRPRG